MKQTKIKFCGFTRAEDVQAACRLAVDALGFNFFSGSKRGINLQKAIEISQGMPGHIDSYAVVVNPDPDWLYELIEAFKPTFLQFHGDETEAFCRQFGYPYIKAIAINHEQDLSDACQMYEKACAILVDTPAGHEYGGTGRSFNWRHVIGAVEKPIILAGGLTVENVTQAIDTVRPEMVDVCSGIEQAPGIKSYRLMQQFIQQVREK